MPRSLSSVASWLLLLVGMSPVGWGRSSAWHGRPSIQPLLRAQKPGWAVGRGRVAVGRSHTTCGGCLCLRRLLKLEGIGQTPGEGEGALSTPDKAGGETWCPGSHSGTSPSGKAPQPDFISGCGATPGSPQGLLQEGPNPQESLLEPWHRLGRQALTWAELSAKRDFPRLGRSFLLVQCFGESGPKSPGVVLGPRAPEPAWSPLG